MRQKQIIRIITGFVLLTALITIPLLTPVKEYLSIPNKIVTFQTSSLHTADLGKAVKVAASEDSVTADNHHNFYATMPGKDKLLYELAGLPIKKTDVSVLKNKKVIPGGQSIGVQMHTKGVLVVGHHVVKTDKGDVSPGEEANIEVGDIILKMDGKDIASMRDVKPIVAKAGEEHKPLQLTVKREGETIKTKLHPVKDKKDHDYRIGLFIRDSAAGIGTMTFYDPETKKYGALGHVISDMDTKKPIEINDGTIVKSSVTSIEKGSDGSPGEKQAKFSVKEDRMGNITKNSPFGIFGKLDDKLGNGIYNKPIPIALANEVKEGPAKILTVLDGEKVEEFDIEIISSIPQKSPATKGMVIEITDPKLLKKTGGIVQGMSGSPIIQDGKIIGAVTHVFVNDSTSGYGVHIEWMMEEAGIKLNQSETKAS
ncbi:SpoIVB peptidase [Virgibacillus sp. 179-BFC.A HS]|uniref:SpoIVB peptidase n=1 Tax=Tigheibacillus jepli TaxID=3035914 RepID=A0ABU5CJC1_9BACI|nr:SpoIVB peptidase [Virgibacillus sp. 179-BFC.A HS]MDY0405623.1 SpoIVB peptidase [Virgibacillus sp. 179-BFC.A HS]